MSSSNNLIVISAPSGSGKTSLAGRVLQAVPDLSFSISHTTRPLRAGERHGVDYFFVSESEFQRMIDEASFLEFAQVHGHWYGTSRRLVLSELEQGRDVLLDIDVQGAMKVRNEMPGSILVFLLPPCFETLRLRLQQRGLDDPAAIERRLQIAVDEISDYKRYDYLIVNEDLEQSVLELKSIVLAARCALPRQRSKAERIIETFR